MQKGSPSTNGYIFIELEKAKLNKATPYRS